jgi:hypothetical protein
MSLFLNWLAITCTVQLAQVFLFDGLFVFCCCFLWRQGRCECVKGRTAKKSIIYIIHFALFIYCTNFHTVELFSHAIKDHSLMPPSCCNTEIDPNLAFELLDPPTAAEVCLRMPFQERLISFLLRFFYTYDFFKCKFILMHQNLEKLAPFCPPQMMRHTPYFH